MVKSKFLSNPEDLGVVAVGFSGGQVRLFFFFLLPSFYCYTLENCSPKASLPLPPPTAIWQCEMA
jgi:hypothetical protein